MQNMTHGANGASRGHRPASSASSASSGSGSSKHVRCIGRYLLTGSTLGKGNFARVEAAVHTLSRSKVAIKIIETDKIKEDYVRKNLLREAQLMRRLRHPNIIRLYETMKTSNLYCLVTEVAEGGELLSHVRNDFKEKRLPEATARPFIRQLVSALYHLHASGVVHRDLKMENILLDRKKKNIKIVDFGLSNALHQGNLLQTHCGSPEYAAPELFIPGREYGPEVDVWSLGVNMYAMLVGKLPFRSPRQGTKKRQKLLEQIQAGVTDAHKKEMAHVTDEGQDLIAKLLQSSSHRRVQLKEVMEHSWITKDGSQPLYPYKTPSPDQSTQLSVIEVMSSVLKLSQTEIRDAVRRDRCDWVAAIYNLLMDQPDGRVILQRILTTGPEEQLDDAAHYHGSMEHFRLSQGDSLDQTSPDIAHMLTASVAQGSHSRHYRHSISGPSQSGSHAGMDPGFSSYPSNTLPLTKLEKKRRHSHESHPLNSTHSNEPRPLSTTHHHPTLNPIQPPMMQMRRASVANPLIHSPYKLLHGDNLSQNVPPPQELPQMVSLGRRLPVTPSEEPYQPPAHEHTFRAHSRAESEPTPLPIPWRQPLLPKNQLHNYERGGGGANISPIRPLSPDAPAQHSVPPLVSPLAQLNTKSSKKGGILRPVRPPSGHSHRAQKKYASVDANLDSLVIQTHEQFSTAGGSLSRKAGAGGGNLAQVGPSRYGGEPQLGWANRSSQIGSLPRKSRDIQALMNAPLPTSPYHSVQDLSGASHAQNGSATSIDLRHELFSSGSSRKSPHGSTTVSPHGSRAVSPHGSRTVSPHGSTTVSPHGSKTVSPYGSTTVSPQQSMRLMSPEGSNVLNADAHSPLDSRVVVKSHENLQKDVLNARRGGGSGDVLHTKRRRRSASAYPGGRSSVEHQEHAASSGKDTLFERSPQNGIMRPSEHMHPLPPQPHRSIGHPRRGLGGREEGTRVAQGRREEGPPKFGSVFKHRHHTHSGSHAHSHDASSDITEI